jgi:aminomethyltransferase
VNRSPLHDANAALGARFVDFGGWEMPVQYESVLAEHKAVRSHVGVFDVTHLGRFELTGPGAYTAIRKLLCNDIDRIEPGRCQYTMILNDSGGIIDDMIIWWWEQDRFWVLPNAANQERVTQIFAAEHDCVVAELQTSTVFLAVQGPDANDAIRDVCGEAPKRFRTNEVEWHGGTLAIAGTGYTGEAGGEICTDPKTGEALLAAFVNAGAVPCGLGSRDTLRLESGLSLWGEDIDETTTPLEAALKFAVSLDHDFVGKEALEHQAAGGVDRLLTGFILSERGIPRHGHQVRTSDSGTGVVTSGNMSPMLQTGVGMAYVSPPPDLEETIEVQIRSRWVNGRLAKPPFHKS